MVAYAAHHTPNTSNAAFTSCSTLRWVLTWKGCTERATDLQVTRTTTGRIVAPVAWRPEVSLLDALRRAMVLDSKSFSIEESNWRHTFLSVREAHQTHDSFYLFHLQHPFA